MENQIIKWLFETNAIQVCPEDKPFWYTSGTLGPYYINTHYLYGSKAQAEDLLVQIEESSKNKETCPSKLFDIMSLQYENNFIYRSVVDLIVSKCNELEFDFISGGERRDFFFSVLAANKTKKPHLSIFKDGDTVLSDYGFITGTIVRNFELEGQKALHIADLVTEASSYLRAWIPSVEALGAKIRNTIAIVDRNQGGKEILEQKGIAFHSFALIKQELFAAALKNKYISENQYELIFQFMDDPNRFMRTFIKDHPHFLDEQIQSGGKSKERALLFIEKGFGLDEKQ